MGFSDPAISCMPSLPSNTSLLYLKMMNGVAVKRSSARRCSSASPACAVCLPAVCVCVCDRRLSAVPAEWRTQAPPCFSPPVWSSRVERAMNIRLSCIQQVDTMLQSQIWSLIIPKYSWVSHRVKKSERSRAEGDCQLAPASNHSDWLMDLSSNSRD